MDGLACVTFGTQDRSNEPGIVLKKHAAFWESTWTAETVCEKSKSSLQLKSSLPLKEQGTSPAPAEGQV